MDKDKDLKEIKNDQLVNEGAGAHFSISLIIS